MALNLYKINVAATTTTEVTPTVTRFFNLTTAPTAAGATLTIDAADFFDDTGAAVVTLPTLATNNSYINVFINGILQQNGNSTYTPGATGVGSLAFAVPAGGEGIITDTAVVVEVVNYAPASTTTVTT